MKLDIPSRSLLLKRKNLQEAMSELRSEFGWLTDDYILKAKELSEEANGKLYLIRAAGEAVTDHRSEGEVYQRKLSANELNSMTRTAIGKKMDINHQPEYETDATILDAEFDPYRKEIVDRLGPPPGVRPGNRCIAECRSDPSPVCDSSGLHVEYARRQRRLQSVRR